MTYELAEKLKNAGFPVRICRECNGTGKDNGWNFMNFGRCPSCDRKGFYRPTLSELKDFVDGGDIIEVLEKEYVEKALLKLSKDKRK